jgi:glycosyltransferase involved in cell wall biosynthesis
MLQKRKPKVIVVIPCYKVGSKIQEVLAGIPKTVSKMVVVDDNCPENTGQIVKKSGFSNTVMVLTNTENMGVGGATKVGYREALKHNPDIVIKIDGDGQMDPQEIDKFISAIVEKKYDYAKGNRFFSINNVYQMPFIRKIGNLGLSFIAKLSTGYYDLFDPNNGFTAISGKCLAQLPLDKLNDRYFFESDMLFQLNLLGARVLDIPTMAIYGDEKSNLKIINSLIEFPKNHLINFTRRILYKYFLRDFNIASIQLILGTILFFWGTLYGGFTWFKNMANNVATTPGTIVLVAIFIITGLQLLLSFLSFDMGSQKRD